MHLTNPSIIISKSIPYLTTSSPILNRKRRIILLSALVGLSTSLPAYSKDALKMTVSASKVVNDNYGNRNYIPVSTAKLGTLIQYKATYENTLTTPIVNTAITLPIPANTVFTGEAYPPSAQGTLDYYNYRDIPLMRRVDGKYEEVPYSEYKALRWDVKFIPARKSVKVAFNTVVN